MEQIRIVRQTLVNRNWDEQIHKYVRGFMIESYLEDGRQDKPEVFGKSITDHVWVGIKQKNLLMKFIIRDCKMKRGGRKINRKLSLSHHLLV